MVVTKYHIKKDGTRGVCTAIVRPCPRGGAAQHFDNPEEMDVAIDKMHERAAKGTFAIGVVNGKIAMDDRTKKSLRDLTSAQVNIKKVENTVKVMKEQVREVLASADIKSLKTEYGTLSAKDASERRSVDIDKLKEAGLYGDYLKETNVKGHVAFRITGDEDGSKMAELVKADNVKLNFSKDDIIIDEDGNAILSENGNRIISQLRSIDLSTKQLAEEHKKLRDELHEVLNEEKLQGLNFGGSYWDNIPEGTSMRIDTSKLKDDGIYDDYLKTVEVNPLLSIRWKK